MATSQKKSQNAGKYVLIEGTALWAKVYENNRDFYGDDEHGKYKLDVVISEELATEYTKRNYNVKRTKDDGKPYVTVSRPHAIDFVDKTTKSVETIMFGTPEVVDENDVAFTKLIPNGSPVRVEAQERFYGTGKVKDVSLRLIKLQVDTRSMPSTGTSNNRIGKLETPLGKGSGFNAVGDGTDEEPLDL